MRRVGIAVLLVAAAVPACHHPNGNIMPAVAPANFTGVWALNGEAQPRRPMPRTRGAARMPGSNLPAREDSVADEPPRPERDSLETALLALPRRLIITQTDSSISMRADSAESGLLHYFDGREMEEVDAAGHRVRVAGAWKGKRYEVTRRLDDDVTVYQSFERSDDGSLLTVRTKIRRDDRTTNELTRSYRRLNTIP